MKTRTVSWTKAAATICALVQIFHVISAILLIAAVFHVIIRPDAVSVSSGEPITVYVFGMDLSLANMSLYAVDGAASIPGVVIYLLFGCVQAAMCFVAFGKVRNVLEYSRSQSPFRWENVERLRQSGFLFLGTVVLQVAYALISLMLSFGGMNLRLDLRLDNVFIGIIVLSIAEIFAQSVRMQEDVDGLV